MCWNVLTMPMLISIHALLAESDAFTTIITICIALISIHALLAESDKMDANTVIQAISFLSTLSLRRATCRQQGKT